MANVSPVYSQPPGTLNIKSTWTPLTTANPNGVGTRKLGNFPDRTVTYEGTFGGVTVALEGSNNSTDGVDGTWLPMTDPQGNAIQKTAAAVESVMEAPEWIRPKTTGGDGTTAITVRIVGKGSR